MKSKYKLRKYINYIAIFFIIINSFVFNWQFFKNKLLKNIIKIKLLLFNKNYFKNKNIANIFKYFFLSF